jgi:hypothetical protein
MSEAREFHSSRKSDIETYQEYVREARFADQDDENLQERYAEHDMSEQVAALTQFDSNNALLFPRTWWAHMNANAPRLRDLDHRQQQDAMADAAGDLLWLATDIGDRCDTTITKACEHALERHVTDRMFDIRSFEDLDEAVLDHAYIIKIPARYANYDAKTNTYDAYVSLAEHPGLVYHRFGERVADALKGIYSTDYAPFGELEELESAVADLVLAMTYIVHDRLGTDIETVADFNKAKSRHTREYGKEFDVDFRLFREASEMYKDECNNA